MTGAYLADRALGARTWRTLALAPEHDWRAAFDQATTGGVGIALAVAAPVAVPVGLAAAAGLRAWRIYQVETGLREDGDGAGRVRRPVAASRR